jgi:hypothetical protein
MVMSCMKEAKKSPMHPPMRLMHRASRRKPARIETLLNPSALKVPISAVLLATAAYMVIMEPKTAPSEKITVSPTPRSFKNLAIISDCWR